MEKCEKTKWFQYPLENKCFPFYYGKIVTAFRTLYDYLQEVAFTKKSYIILKQKGPSHYSTYLYLIRSLLVILLIVFKETLRDIEKWMEFLGFSKGGCIYGILPIG